MDIEDCIKKEIFGSFEKAKLPSNLHEYSCELFIEQYAQGMISEEVKYFRFTPRAGVRGQPFNIMIDSIAKPKNLIFSYKVNEEGGKQSAQVFLNNRVEYKFQTTVVEPQHPQSHLMNIDDIDEEGEYFMRDIDEDMLRPSFRLKQYSQEQEAAESSQAQGGNISEGDFENSKTQLIKFLHGDDNRKSKIKEIKQYLASKGHKSSEAQVKRLLQDICKSSVADKKVGYVLKDIFFSQEEYDRKNPRKRVKDE